MNILQFSRLRIKSAFICGISGVLLLLPLSASAHVGSPDFYYDGYAGPYHLLVTVRPPAVIPGIAEIQIRVISTQLSRVEILPMRLVGQGAKLAPTPDVAERSGSDPQLFTGKLWLMSRGSWKVQINVEGPQGKGEAAVPIAAASAASLRMQKSLGILLAGLGLLLVVGLVGIIGAANRDAVLEPGVTPSPSQRRRGSIITAAAATVIVIVVVLGNFWWTADASHTAKLSYKLPHVQLSLAANVLQLSLQNPNDVNWRQYPSELEDLDRIRLTDLMEDHRHKLHLFLVRMPDMTSFWHLHPNQENGPEFFQVLPMLPAGHYRVFADIVHKTGFPETQVGEIDLPAAPQTTPLLGDDAGAAQLTASDKISQLSDGYRMVWERDSAPLKANQAIWFRFRIEDSKGLPATDLEDYMGMAGHAAFIRDDGRVFAHVHPAGSISMAAAELAQGEGTSDSSTSSKGMSAMNHAAASAEVTFPYGFPSPGDYHIFVQIKHAGRIETGSFIAHVAN